MLFLWIIHAAERKKKRYLPSIVPFVVIATVLFSLTNVMPSISPSVKLKGNMSVLANSPYTMKAFLIVCLYSKRTGYPSPMLCSPRMTSLCKKSISIHCYFLSSNKVRTYLACHGTLKLLQSREMEEYCNLRLGPADLEEEPKVKKRKMKTAAAVDRNLEK